MKTEMGQLAIAYICLYSLSQVFNDIHDKKWSKVYVPYLYTQIKFENITVYIDNKKGEALTS